MTAPRANLFGRSPYGKSSTARWRVHGQNRPSLEFCAFPPKKDAEAHRPAVLSDVQRRDMAAGRTNGSVIIDARIRHGEADGTERADVLYLVRASRRWLEGDRSRAYRGRDTGGRRPRGDGRDAKRGRRRRGAKTTPPGRRLRLDQPPTGFFSFAYRAGAIRPGRPGSAAGGDHGKGASPPHHLRAQAARVEELLLGFERHVHVFMRPRGQQSARPGRRVRRTQVLEPGVALRAPKLPVERRLTVDDDQASRGMQSAMYAA